MSQTFSKAWGLASARVGTAYANEEIIALYNKVKPPYNVSALNQNSALLALNNSTEYRNNLNRIIAERLKLKTTLNEIGLVKKIYPSDANFLLIEVENATEVYSYLISKKIITRNRSSYVRNCIRISVGKTEENNKLIKALKSIK